MHTIEQRPNHPEPVLAIIARVQLLQRQVLRADGLSNLERDQILGNLAAVLSTVEHLNHPSSPPRPTPDPGAHPTAPHSSSPP